MKSGQSIYIQVFLISILTSIITTIGVLAADKYLFEDDNVLVSDTNQIVGTVVPSPITGDTKYPTPTSTISSTKTPTPTPTTVATTKPPTTTSKPTTSPTNPNTPNTSNTPNTTTGVSTTPLDQTTTPSVETTTTVTVTPTKVQNDTSEDLVKNDNNILPIVICIISLLALVSMGVFFVMMKKKNSSENTEELTPTVD